MQDNKISVAVVYNHVGEDEYEKIRTVDPTSLDFKPEYDLNVATVREEYEALAAALERRGYATRLLNVEEDLGKLHQLLRHDPPDVVFNLIEFFHDDPKLEFLVAGMFELYRVPYTGAPPFALALCQRKGITKHVLLANGVPTPQYRLLREGHISRSHGLKFPVIVKPAREDASSGVEPGSVVHNQNQLQKRVRHTAKEFGLPILVEEFVEGRELHVSILGNNPPEVLPMIEFDFSDLPPEYPKIISYDAKWNPLNEAYHRVHSLCPAKVSKRLAERIAQASLQAYTITGCRDYARLDIRVSKDNQVHVLEVNPNPDLTEGVSFMESAEKAGHLFDETLEMIVQFALSRHPRKN